MSDDQALSGDQAVLLATLLALEQRVRAMVAERLASIVPSYGASLAAAIKRHPTASATEILSQAELHTALTSALNLARVGIETALRAGYHAAAQLAITNSVLGELADEPDIDPDFLDAIIADVQAAFAQALLDIPNAVRAAHDGVHGQDPVPARILTTAEALQRAVRRLGVHTNAAAAVAVHRGFTDGQTAAATAHKVATANLALRKRWQVTSATPCPACAALHDTVVALHEEFDHHASTDPNVSPPRVYRNLLGPPRHPNCRCRLRIEHTTASAAVRRAVNRTSPAGPGHLTAREVRQMPSAAYTALTRFLFAVATKLRRLLRRIRGG